MNRRKTLLVLVALVSLTACAPRSLSDSSQNREGSESQTNPTENDAGGSDKNGTPEKLRAAEFGKARTMEEVARYFTSETASNPALSRHLIGDWQALKIRGTDQFIFYKPSLRIMNDGTYTFMITVSELGGGRLSYNRISGQWKIDDEEIVLERGKGGDGLPPIKGKGVFALDNSGNPELFMEFSNKVKTAVGGYEIPLDDSWYVLRYNPGVIDKNL